jgi:hypothetical protein
MKSLEGNLPLNRNIYWHFYKKEFRIGFESINKADSSLAFSLAACVFMAGPAEEPRNSEGTGNSGSSHAHPLQKNYREADFVNCLRSPEPVLLNVYGAPELMPRNEFRQPM